MEQKYNASTNASIFLRLGAAESDHREMAWDEFRARYTPIIANFAHKLGARSQDVDDVIQDVMLGFFLVSPRFVYDPSKGRFRGYLKICTYRALLKRIGKQIRVLGVPFDEIDPEAPVIETIWSDVWERELVARAIAQIREQMSGSRTFNAFEAYVLREIPAEEVAQSLGMHVNSIYRAKEEITRLLAGTVRQLQAEDD